MRFVEHFSDGKSHHFNISMIFCVHKENARAIKRSVDGSNKFCDPCLKLHQDRIYLTVDK